MRVVDRGGRNIECCISACHVGKSKAQISLSSASWRNVTLLQGYHVRLTVWTQHNVSLFALIIDYGERWNDFLQIRTHT